MSSLLKKGGASAHAYLVDCTLKYVYDLHLSNYILLFLIFQPSYGSWFIQNVFLPNMFQINGYILRKFCIDISIVEEWYGIASGLILFRNNGVQKQQSYDQS